MNHIAKAIRIAVSAETKRHAFSASKVFVRHSSVTTWNKDWMPGPYPKTEAERIAAAKKYNMIPEDYEPYPEEEGYGDYPKFSPVHMENRDDFQVYDFPVLKRNFGEPLHPDFDICLEDKTNFQKEYRTPLWKQFLYVLSGVIIWCSAVLYTEAHPIDLQRVPKQYPYKGGKSYTFEPVE